MGSGVVKFAVVGSPLPLRGQLRLGSVADNFVMEWRQDPHGRSDRAWFAPSVDLSVHLLDDCRSSWVLAHNRARFAGDGYASADMALWDCGDDGAGPPRLVAYATQLFLFTFQS